MIERFLTQDTQEMPTWHPISPQLTIKLTENDIQIKP